MITDAQSRMARAAVRWSVRDLARHAEVSAATVNRFEMGRAEANRATVAAIERALEAAGVEFLPDNGVRLKVAQVATPSPKPEPGRSSQPGSDQDAGTGASKPTPSGKPAPRAKAATMSKYEQIRALRERNGR